MDFADLPRDYVWLISLCMLAEVCAVLDDQRRAVSLYQLLLPFAARNVISSAGIMSLGPVSHYLGVLATVMRRWDQAVEHLDESLLWSGRQGAMVSAARSRVACARALLERARPGDLVKAQGLLNEAYTTAEELGLAGITTMCRRLQLLAEMTTPVDTGTPGFGYGLGLAVLQTPSGRLIGHDGAIPGFLNNVWNTENGRRQFGIMISEFSLRPP